MTLAAPVLMPFVRSALVATCLFAGVAAHAHEPLQQAAGVENETPAGVKDVGITPHIGDNVDLNLTFKDEDGKDVKLGEFTGSGKPILLSLAYYGCPSLCNYHLNGLNDAFKALKQPLGSEFNAVIISIQPTETPALAKLKKASYVEEYGRPEGAQGWHFITGTQENITKVAQAVGFRYHWDEKEKQFAHVSAAYILTPEGKISRYLYGIAFDPKTVRWSIIEASEGKVGNVVDQLILYCFHFDPKQSKYSLAAFNVMRGGGALAVVILAAFMIPFWLRSRRKGTRTEGES